MPRRAADGARRGAAAALAVWMATAPGPRSAAASDVLFGLVHDAGELGFSVDGRSSRFDRRRSSSFDPRYRGWLKIPISGRLVEPSAFSYTLTLRPAFLRSVAREDDQQVLARQFDYDATARLFSGRMLSLAVATARSRGTSERGGDRLSEFDAGSASADLALGWDPLPLRLGVARRGTWQTWTISPLTVPLLQSNRLTSWRFAAENTRTRATLERSDYADLVGGQDYGTWSGAFGHALRWGKGSQLQSAAGWNVRDHAARYRQASWDERLHLQHLRGLGSDWSWGRSESRAGSFASRSESFGAGLHHRAAAWLGWGLRASSRSTRVRGQRSGIRSVAPSLSLTATRGPKLHLRASADVGYEVAKQRTPPGVQLAVLQESHLVSAGRGFVLDQPGVDPASVVVRSADNSLVFTVGVDFALEAVGVLLRVDLTPASRIQPGQAVVVDYRYAPARRPDARALTPRYDLTLVVGGVTLHHRRSSRVTASGAAGLAPAVPDHGDIATGLETSLGTRAGRLRLRAERSERTAKDYDYVADEVEADLALPPGLRTQAALGANWSGRTGAGRRVSVTSARGAFSWMAMEGLRLDAGLDGYVSSRSGTPREGVVGGMLQSDLRVASLQVVLRVAQQHRTAGGTVRQASLRVVRRF